VKSESWPGISAGLFDFWAWLPLVAIFHSAATPFVSPLLVGSAPRVVGF
jgi:hypothetical protein